ncbi:dolichol kinase [Nilaparvata lugens]|uniref:dolichol kinase n=1 Tax=Nilaparvata lugens TaxID=108931 RepID=UPI00193D122F|nr:dolichol kinase [Nilaparvata lugens]
MTLYIKKLDQRLETILKEKKLKTRRHAGHGPWLSLLLPVAVIIGTKAYECSWQYRVSGCVSMGLLTNSLFIQFQMSSNFLSRTVACLLTSAVTVSSLSLYTDQGVAFKVLIALLTSLGFQKLLLTVLQDFPRSFTFGEACFAVQSFILFLSASVANFCFKGYTDCMQKATLILQVGLCGIGLLCVLLKLFPKLKKPAQFCMITLGVVGFVVIPLSHVLLGQSAVIWIIYQLTQDLFTVKLVLYWLLCCVIAVLVVIVQVSAGYKSSTITRKTFHVLALAVFLPGFIYRPCLLYLASGVLFALFVVLEIVRMLNLPVIGGYLEAGFAAFADSKDEGPLALTPIYLLIGFAGPLWLHPSLLLPPTLNSDDSGISSTYSGVSPGHLLPLLAGLLSVGVGDTAASVCGTWFGRHYWDGSKKTKEGSAACFISQLFALLVLIHFGFVPRTNLLEPISSIVVTSLVEAYTTQVDNLVLPLLMYIVLL